MLPRRKRVSRKAFPERSPKRSFRLSVGTLKVFDAEAVSVAVVVSKKIAKRAPDRHSIKRKIYTAFSHWPDARPGTYVLYANQSAARTKMSSVLAELKNL